MTRRSITAVLASLLVALFVVVNAPVVSADDGCDPADAATVDACVALAVNQPAVSVASVGPAVAVMGIDYRFVEQNTITLPSVSDALATNASPALTMAQYQFIEKNTILPSAGPQTYMEDVTPNPGRPY
jgi:hypothetical protein